MTLTPPSSNIVQFPARKDFDRQRFAWIERVILDHSLTHLACRVGVRIATKYLNATSGDAWPSQGTLAAELGVTRKGIQGALKALAGAGHMTVEGTCGYANHYRPVFGEPTCVTSDAPPCHPAVAPPCHPPFAQSFLRHPSKGTHLKKEKEEEEKVSAIIEDVRQEERAEPKAAINTEAVLSFDVATEEDEANYQAVLKCQAAFKKSQAALKSRALAEPPQGSAAPPTAPARPIKLTFLHDDPWCQQQAKAKIADKQDFAKAALLMVPPEELWGHIRGAAGLVGQLDNWAANRFKELTGEFPDRAWNEQDVPEHPSEYAFTWNSMALTAYAKSNRLN